MDSQTPGDRLPSVAAGQRIGDAERDDAAAALSEHFAAGRLDRDEFDVRLAAAYAARTGADLQPLFTDLPAPEPAGGRAAGPQGIRRRSPRFAYAVPVLPLILLVVAVT